MKIRKKIALGMAIPMMAVFTITVATVLSLYHTRELEAWVNHTHQVIEKVQNLVKLVLDMETGERGYLLTGEERFLAPYHQALNSWDEELASLMELIKDNPPQQDLARSLDALKKEWLVRAAQPGIEARRNTGPDEARELVATEKGKQLIDELRRQVDIFVRAEKILLEQRSAEAQRASGLTLILVVTAAAVALLSGLMAVFFTPRGIIGGLQSLLEGTRRVTRSNGTQGSSVDDAPTEAHRIDTSCKISVESKDEFLEVATAFNRMLDEIAESQERAEAGYQSLEDQKARLESTNSQLIQSRQTLQQQTMELEMASRYKSEFLSNMSHELRTPLNSMLILSRMLKENKEGHLDARQVEYASTIYHSGNELLDLINDILDLSKVEAGKLEIHPEPLLLHHLADQIRRNFSHVAETHKLEFTVAIAETVPAEITTDRKRVNQVLKNLLSNAFKFCSEGSVSVTFRPAAPGMRFTAPNLSPERALAIAVADTGVGIPNEKKQEIFKAFQQADGKTSRQYGGTGLGLSISRKLAHLLGGEIQVESEVGSGSTFTLYLPLDPARPDTDTPASADGTPGQHPPAKPPQGEKKVVHQKEPLFTGKAALLIDKNVRHLFELTHMLEEEGIQILIARTLKEALEQLHTEAQTDLVLVDVSPPEEDGLNTIRCIRQSEAFNSLPIIALTPHAAPNGQQPCREAGANDCLTRPLDAQRLASLIGNYL